MTKKLKVKFPYEIYVVREQDGDDSYLIPYETLDDIDDKQVVAVYQHVSSGTMKVNKQIIN